MKTFKIKLLKFLSSFLVLLLSVFGFFSSCIHSGTKYGPPPHIITPAEYGAPYARFIVKGTVLSEMNNKAIPNIKIIGASDTIFSDVNGKFQIEKIAFPNDNIMNLSFEDTDGNKNGEFLPLNYEIDFKEVPFTGSDSSWNNGEALKEVEIHLKQK